MANDVFVIPSKETYKELVATGSNTILVVDGKQLIKVPIEGGKSRYVVADIDVSDAANAIVDASNAVSSTIVNVSEKVASTASSTLDSMKEFSKKFDNSINAKSIQETISTLGGNLFTHEVSKDVTQFDIGNALGLNEGLGNAFGTGVSDAAKKVGNAVNKASKEITNFVAPVKEVVDTLYGIGKEFDRIIQDTFLGQIFGLRGPEILCIIFCIIVSMLSCSSRQHLYELIVQIRQGIRNANMAIKSINNITRNPVEVPLFNSKSITDNISDLFGSRIGGKNLKDFLNIPDGTSTRTKVTPPVFEIPPSVVEIIQTITTILSVLAKGQITVPVGLSGVGGVWDFADAVLGIIREYLIQLLDQFITEYINKLEKMLKKMMPQICIGNLATVFINKIIRAIKAIKDFLMEQLRGMIGDMHGFGIKWKTFGWYFKEIQELLAILNALGLILKNFPDLALACGVQPCNGKLAADSDLIRSDILDLINEIDNAPITSSVETVDPVNKTIEDIIKAVANDEEVKETNTPASLYPIDSFDPPKDKVDNPTLDKVTEVFKDVVGNDDVYVYPNPEGGTNSFNVVLPDMFKDAPLQIRQLTESPEFLATLGNAYTVYSAPESITIVYTYRLHGGE